AAIAAGKTAERDGDVGDSEQAPVAGGDLDEVADEPADLSLVEDGGDGASLFFGREDRAADEALEVGAFVEEGGETIEVGLDGGKCLVAQREVEEVAGITFGNSRTGRRIVRHLTRCLQRAGAAPVI